MRDSRPWWWTVLSALTLAGMLSSLGGTWDAPPGAPPMATPRGTAPLPPVRTPSAAISPGSPQPGQPPAPPAATPTTPSAPVGIAPAPPTATPTPAPLPPEPLVTASPTPATAPAANTAAATRTAALPGQASPTAVIPVSSGTASSTATPPTGLIAIEVTPSFPAVLAPRSEVMVQPGGPVVLTTPDRRVSVAVAAGAVRVPTRLTVTAGSFTADQRDAAVRQGLLLTNLGFTLATAPDEPPQAEITVRYSAAQVSGIAEPSLTLFQRRPADGSWQPVPDCRVETGERTVVCMAPATGDFLLAGTQPETLNSGAPSQPSETGRETGSRSLLLWSALAAAAVAAAAGLAFGIRQWRVRQ